MEFNDTDFKRMQIAEFFRNAANCDWEVFDQ